MLSLPFDSTSSSTSSSSSCVSNGRVALLPTEPPTQQLFAMYDRIPANQCSTLRNPTEGLWEETTLSTAFFSKQNIQTLQNGIRAGVYHRSRGQYTIGEQDCDSLKIIMRSLYLQHAAHQSDQVAQQVDALNALVLQYCIPQVYSEAEGYMQYIVDASTMYTPLSQPVMTRSNDKELELKPWF